MITVVEWCASRAMVPSLGSQYHSPIIISSAGETIMTDLVCRLWKEEQGQDIAEYAVMLAVILVIVVVTIRLIGSNSNNVFSTVASSIQ